MPKCWSCGSKTETIDLGNGQLIKVCSECGRARRPNQSVTQIIICRENPSDKKFEEVSMKTKKVDCEHYGKPECSLKQSKGKPECKSCRDSLLKQAVYLCRFSKTQPVAT